VEKRLPLALILCCLILMGWTMMFPPPKSVESESERAVLLKSEVVEQEASKSDRAPTAQPLVSEETERTLEVEFGTPGTPGSYFATFTNRGGRLLSLRLGDAYDQEGLGPAEQAETTHWVELLRPVLKSDGGMVASFGLAAAHSAKRLFPETLDEALWKMEELTDEFGEKLGVRFTYGSAQGAVLTKELRPRAGTRIIDLTLGLENVSAKEPPGARQFTLTPAACVAAQGESRFYVEPQAIGAWADEDGEIRVEVEDMVASPKADDLSGAFNSTGTLIFTGAHSKFFACLLQATPDSQSTLVGSVSWRRIPDYGEATAGGEREPTPYPYVVADVDLALHLGEVGERKTWEYSVYAGPKAREELTRASPDYEALTLEDLGWFVWIAQRILSILGFYHGLVGNWGWAIILMTLTVRLVLFPINRRSQTAMARFATKTKRIQPQIDAIKEKYANNPQKLREEQARIMQEEGAMPPLGGCLPLFLQFPIFIGLFQSLRVEYHLRQEPFMLWISDLSQPDRLIPNIDLNTHLPFIGTIEHLNVLPFLMVTFMILQQSAMPTPTDPQQAKMQKMMRWFMVVIGFMLYSYPAGLALYMITSSSLGLFEIKVIKKFWPIDDTEQPAKKGWMMRMAEKQAEQQTALKKMQQQQHMSRQKAQKARKKRKR